MHRLIEVLDRLHAMPVEIVFRDLEFMLGGAWVPELRRYVDAAPALPAAVGLGPPLPPALAARAVEITAGSLKSVTLKMLPRFRTPAPPQE